MVHAAGSHASLPLHIAVPLFDASLANEVCVIWGGWVNVITAYSRYAYVQFMVCCDWMFLLKLWRWLCTLNLLAVNGGDSGQNKVMLLMIRCCLSLTQARASYTLTRQQGSFTVRWHKQPKVLMKDMQDTLINIMIKTLVIIYFDKIMGTCTQNYAIINHNNSKISLFHIVLSWLHYTCHAFGLTGVHLFFFNTEIIEH